MSENTLPFELNESAVYRWLSQLPNNPATAAHALNQVVKSLRPLRKEVETRQVLLALGPSIQNHYQTLEKFILSIGPMDDLKKRMKLEKLCIQLLRNFSLAICYYNDKLDEDNMQKCMNLYLSLKFIGLTQKASCIFHQYPSETLYQKVCDIYQEAKDDNLIDQLTPGLKHELTAPPTLKFILKHNLLFQLFQPYRFTSVDIDRLFKLAYTLTESTDLKNTPQDTTYAFVWSLEKPTIPYPQTHINDKTKNQLTLHNPDILKNIHSSPEFSSLSPTGQKQLTELFTGYQNIIHDFSTTDPDIKHIIIGFKPIIEFMTKLDKLQKILNLSQVNAPASALSQLSIEPLDYQKSHLSPDKRLSGNNSIHNLLKELLTVKLLATKDKCFLLAESNRLEAEIGELCLLCDEKLQPFVALIRQKRTTNVSGSRHYLLERIPGKLSLEHLDSPPPAASLSVLVSTDLQQTTLITDSGKFSNQTRLMFRSEYQIRINQCSDITPWSLHYQCLPV
jgi:hypothetical protein